MTAGQRYTLPQAFCDANVLHLSLLRGLLIRLNIKQLCYLRWSTEVNEEWIHALVRDCGLPHGLLDQTRAPMNRSLLGAAVTGFHRLISELILPDPDDRHVPAAAMHSGTPHLLTFNLSDFPAQALPTPAPQIIHPDLWLAPVLTHDLQATCRVLRKLVAPFRRPPVTIPEVADRLARLQLPKSAQVIYCRVTQDVC